MPVESATLFDALPERGSSPPFRAASVRPPPSEPALPLPLEPTIDLAEQLPPAIAVVQDGRLVFANAALASYFGYSSSAPLIGMRLETFVHEHVVRDAQSATLAWLTAGDSAVRRQDQELCRMDGTLLSAECTSKPVGFGKRRATAYVWHDTARTRHAQARTARAERLTSLAKLAAGVAHEVNNPLAYMAVNLDLALEELKALRSERPGDIAIERLLDVELALTDVREGVRRVGRTIDDLNTLVLSGRSETTLVDLSAVLDAAFASIERRLPQQTEVRRSYAEVPKIRGSEIWLHRALHEVLSNAALALSAARGERVLVLTIAKTTGNTVSVSIEDSGPGVNAESIDRVFEPYYAMRSSGGGRGLGLSVAHGIVTSFGGSMELESAPGKRTRVTMRLPFSG